MAYLSYKGHGNRPLVTDKLNQLVNYSVARHPSPVAHFTA